LIQIKFDCNQISEISGHFYFDSNLAARQVLIAIKSQEVSGHFYFDSNCRTAGAYYNQISEISGHIRTFLF